MKIHCSKQNQVTRCAVVQVAGQTEFQQLEEDLGQVVSVVGCVCRSVLLEVYVYHNQKLDATN